MPGTSARRTTPFPRRRDSSARTPCGSAARRSPWRAAGLDTAGFTRRIGALHAGLDHAHPSSDGNRRTPRTFVGQFAGEAGHDIDWDRFARSADGRDRLCMARDRSVNEIALPLVRHPDTLARIRTRPDAGDLPP